MEWDHTAIQRRPGYASSKYIVNVSSVVPNYIQNWLVLAEMQFTPESTHTQAVAAAILFQLLLFKFKISWYIFEKMTLQSQSAWVWFIHCRAPNGGKRTFIRRMDTGHHVFILIFLLNSILTCFTLYYTIIPHLWLWTYDRQQCSAIPSKLPFHCHYAAIPST